MTYDARTEAHAMTPGCPFGPGIDGRVHSHGGLCNERRAALQRAHDAGRASAFRVVLAEIRAEFDVAMKLEGKGSDVGMAAYLMAAIERLAAAPPPAGTGT